ncbi:MAG: hypothetical protein KC492_40190 [Myxococcales bacterium]|nr:hypothetical protein [Myxococcales bacterium]
MTARRTIWVGAILALAYSMFNLGEWFGQFSSSKALGFALAAAVDVGILACMRAAAELESGKPLRVVAALAMVSWLGNAQHALMVRIGRLPLMQDWSTQDATTIGNVWFIAGIAPLIALALAWVYEQMGAPVASGIAQSSAHASVERSRPKAQAKRRVARKAGGETYERIRKFAAENPAIATKKELAEALGVAASSVTRAGVERNGAGWRVEA